MCYTAEYCTCTNVEKLKREGKETAINLVEDPLLGGGAMTVTVYREMVNIRDRSGAED